jgi:hypothetical protein
MIKNSESLVELWTYYSYPEYNKIELILKSENIKYLNRSFEDSAYNGIYTLKYGLGKIYVLKSDFRKAKEALNKFLK